MTAKDGDLALPDGMRYRLLVVDLEDDQALPAALRKIAALRQAGATVAFGQRKPQRAPGLAGYPAANDETQRLADVLWADSPTLAESLQQKNILPDFEGPPEYIHRRNDNLDIYFVSGQGAAECVFRVSAKQPELWDAVSGAISDATHWSPTGDGRTRVSLELPRTGSAFVVFRKPAPRPAPTPPAPPPSPVQMALIGPWNVRFEPHRGAPASAVFEQLIPWNEHPDSRIRHFSGMATYQQTFVLAGEQVQSPARLQLGKVECIAQVRLNGKNLGIVWTDPWSVKLTGALKPGRNNLEIHVVNTWFNRLIGDAALPPKKRVARTNVALQPGKRTFKAYQGFASEDPLMTSGLLGPVRLELPR